MTPPKEEANYEDEVAEKLKEIAKLQARIDALSLDDSRKAQAEKMSLEEELAELQKDLADTQADHATDVMEDALDKQYDAYAQEKDSEIEVLKESISSTQKLYDMAIQYIRDHWNTLYSELISWNTEYGTSLNSEITEAWEAAQSAAQRYGDFVTAIMGGIKNEIASITQQITSLDNQISNLGNSTSSSGTTQRPITVSPNTQHTKPNESDMAQAKKNMVGNIVSQMRAKSLAWHTASDASKQTIANEGLQLGNSLASLGVSAQRDNNGVWWIRSDSLNPSNVGKKLYDCYHTGGRVGEEPLKPNEEYIKAEKGELIMTANQQDSFAAQVDSFKTMADAFEKSYMNLPVTSKGMWPNGVVEGGSSSISNVTNNNQPTEIHMGDITINTLSGNGKIIADEVRKITRENVNQITHMLRR